MIQAIKQQHSGWLINGSMSVPDNAENRHYQEIQDAINGTGDYEGTPIPVEPEFTDEQIFANAKAELTSTVQNHLDSEARVKGYDNILSACSYASSSMFGSEAQAFVVWRDSVWQYCYDALDNVKGKKRIIPTIEELLAELPPLGL